MQFGYIADDWIDLRCSDQYSHAVRMVSGLRSAAQAKEVMGGEAEARTSGGFGVDDDR